MASSHADDSMLLSSSYGSLPDVSPLKAEHPLVGADRPPFLGQYPHRPFYTWYRLTGIYIPIVVDS